MNSIINKLSPSTACSYVQQMFASGRWYQQPHVFAYGKVYVQPSKIILRFASTETRENIEKVELANTNSYQGKTAMYGVFWGENDPMNTLKPCSPARNSAFYSAIEAMNLALRQAIYERKMTQLEIHSDSDYLINCAKMYLKNWRRNGYITKSGSPVKHKEDLQDLDTLLEQIKVTFVKMDSSSGVLEKLKNDPNIAVKLEPEVEDAEMYRPNSSDKNVIFVCTDGAERYGQKILGYGVHFPGKDYLNVKGKFAQFPHTTFRNQMYAILTALETAKQEGLKDVKIVCDSAFFLKYYKRGWKKNDGEFVKNHQYYEKIAKLAEELNATFQYLPQESEDPNFKAAAQLAEDGLGMPIVTNAKTSAAGGGGRKKKMQKEEEAD